MGDWAEDLRASNPLMNQAPSSTVCPTSDTVRAGPAAAPDEVLAEKAFPSPDWPSARRMFPNWLWLGLVSEEGPNRDKTTAGNGLGAGGFDHARGQDGVVVSQYLILESSVSFAGYVFQVRFDPEVL